MRKTDILSPFTLEQIVPIHINNPIHPNSANKHKRLGLKILNELSRIEMFVTRIETVGKVRITRCTTLYLVPKTNCQTNMSRMHSRTRQDTDLPFITSITITARGDPR